MLCALLCGQLMVRGKAAMKARGAGLLASLAPAGPLFERSACFALVCAGMMAMDIRRTPTSSFLRRQEPSSGAAMVGRRRAKTRVVSDPAKTGPSPPPSPEGRGGRAGLPHKSRRGRGEPFAHFPKEAYWSSECTPTDSRVTSSLSMRAPSRSTTSKRMPCHSNTSPVCGIRPSAAITMPATVRKSWSCSPGR